MSLDGLNAAFAVTGDKARPSAHSTEISSRITPERIRSKDYLSMNHSRFMIVFIWSISCVCDCMMLVHSCLISGSLICAFVHISTAPE